MRILDTCLENSTRSGRNKVPRSKRVGSLSGGSGRFSLGRGAGEVSEEDVKEVYERDLDEI